MSKLRIMDWYVHQGHQYEFFKTGHNFFLSDVGGEVPSWNSKHRPMNKNLRLDKEKRLLNTKFDVVIVRSPLHHFRYNPFLSRGAFPIAVVQTTEPFKIQPWVRVVVWNSKDVMRKYRDMFPRQKHFYIPHGYDPNEFKKIDYKKNGKILSVYNVFKKRSSFLGYDLWKSISDKTGLCSVYGHGNEDMNMGIKECDTLEQLIDIYNTYSIFLNTTLHSAMPRSRAEAAMCGMPIVSTDNYDIGRYFKNKKNSILTNDRHEMLDGIRMLLNSKQMREDYGNKSREIAIKHFNLKDYVERWQRVFSLV